MHSQSYAIMELNVTGSMIAPRIKTCRMKAKGVRNTVAVVLGLHENLVEALWPTQIPNGLRLKFNLFINLFQRKGLGAAGCKLADVLVAG